MTQARNFQTTCRERHQDAYILVDGTGYITEHCINSWGTRMGDQVIDTDCQGRRAISGMSRHQ